jgi:glycosyltransferase involved in cell wall biosynthesis
MVHSHTSFLDEQTTIFGAVLVMGLWVSVIIPAYNEEKRLPSLLRKLPKSYDVVVAANGSKDGTIRIAKEWGAKVMNHTTKLGKGGAILQSLELCKYDTIVTMDVDCHSPWRIKDLVDTFHREEATILFTRRHYKHLYEPPLRRRISTKLFRLYTWLLFGYLPDTQSGFKIIDKAFLKSLQMSIKGYAWDVELYLKARERKVKVVEYPILDTWESSKVNMLKDGINMGVDLFKYWWSS